MPAPQTLVKAQLQPITWDKDGQVTEIGEAITVQFNPESLKVAYANRSVGGDQRGGSAIQFVGTGTTKLSLDLWFDVTAPVPNRPSVGGAEVDDVRRLTKQVVDFIHPKDMVEKGKFIPPGMRFLWGTFLFEGVVDSINESLDFFSEQGKPLRAKLSLSLSTQDIQFEFNKNPVPSEAVQPAAAPRPPTRAGESVQQVAARAGRQDDWQEIANRSGIDNPRNLPAGTPLDLH